MPSHAEAVSRRMHWAALHLHNKALQVIELSRCIESVVYWCNHWCWTYDSRLPAAQRDVPFDLFAVQMEYLLWRRERVKVAEKTGMASGGVVPKSRGQGATWLAAVDHAHHWLFEQNYSGGFGSLKLEEVDEVGNMNTILEKIRYIFRRLPYWMMPKGYREDKHATHAKIIHPKNGSAIVGEGGSNMGRGGKATVFDVDEAAHLADTNAVNSALAENTNCRIDTSTPHGAGGDFFRKCHSGDYVPFDPCDPVIHQFSKFTMHWTNDPRKNKEWAEAKKKEIGPVNWAEQYEIDFSASLDNITIPALWVRAAVELDLPEGDGPEDAGLDCAGEGANRTVFIHGRGPVVRMPIWWNGLDTTQSAHKAAEQGEKKKVSVINYDVSGLGIGYKGAWKAMDRVLPFKTIPVNGGESPTDSKWPDGKTSKELFVNRRIEEWWKVRARFEKTYEYVNGIADHPPDEMISIPNHPELIAQLSAPIYEVRETGKKQLESKKAMRSRGVASPDFADALVLRFTAPPKKKKAVWW